jgi:Family of unknown function (DUF6307)
MTSNTLFVSRYDYRVKLAQDIVKENTQLSDQECRALAVRLVHTLDTIPEKVR